MNDYKIANRQIFSSPPPPQKIDSGGLKFCFIMYNYYSFLGHILPLISRQLMQQVLRFVHHATDSTSSHCTCLYFILFSLVLYAPVNVVVLFFFFSLKVLSSDPLLASLPLSRRTDLQQSSVSLGGFPTDFLRQVVRPLFLSFLFFSLPLSLSLSSPSSVTCSLCYGCRFRCQSC